MKKNDYLKLIAIITMLIDHIGVLLFPSLTVLRQIGRIAFPIFAYHLATGFIYTKNKRKYFNRLFIFGIISQLPFMFLNYEARFKPFQTNVILYFVYIFIILLFLDRYRKNKNKIYLLIGIILIIIPQLMIIYIKDFRFSYGLYGILLVLSFYYFNNKRILILMSTLVANILYPFIEVSNYLLRNNEFSLNRLKILLMSSGDIFKLNGIYMQLQSYISIPIITLLSLKKPKFKLNKYIAYWFYPIHITILLIIRYYFGTF